MSLTLFTPPTLTAEQETLATMDQLHNETMQMLAAKLRQAFDLFWNNERTTPEQMEAALGANAKAAFDRHAALVHTVLTFAPGLMQPAEYTPPRAYTFANDGSMTLL